jgi:hypothetical protein
MHYPARALDAAPPPPAITVAATDLYPRNAREQELCDAASRPDWLYLAIPPVLLAGAIVLDVSDAVKYAGSAPVRVLGSGSIGLTWGLLVGSIYPSMPKCSHHFTTTAPPEGQVRTTWPIAVSFALLAAITAPILDYVALGPVPVDWGTDERVTRVVVASALAFGTAFIPYLIPPKPMRATRELLNLRPAISAHSAFISYSLQF